MVTSVDGVVDLVAVACRCFLLSTVIFSMEEEGRSTINHQKVTRVRMSRGRLEERYEIIIQECGKVTGLEKHSMILGSVPNHRRCLVLEVKQQLAEFSTFLQLH